MSAKSKGIANRSIYLSLLCLVVGKVQAVINFRIIRKMVDRWWYQIMLYGKY